MNKARSIAVKYYTTAWNGAIVFGRLGGRASTISHGRASDKPILSCLNFFTETDIYFGIITYTYTYTYMNVYIHIHTHTHSMFVCFYQVFFNWNIDLNVGTRWAWLVFHRESPPRLARIQFLWTRGFRLCTLLGKYKFGLAPPVSAVSTTHK